MVGGLLQRKLLRDLTRLWSQVLTIALVVASAVGALVTTQACVSSLESARASFYREARMADLFATVRRAPRSALAEFESIEGVAQVQATIERPARLLLPGVDEPVMGRLIGVSPQRPLVINQVHLRQTGPATPSAGVESGGQGLWPGAPQGNGVWPAWVSDGFAVSRGLRPGDRLEALINGHRRTLEIRALALAPDVVFAGAMGMPDPRGFGVLWVDEAALAAAWDLEGAWTHLVVRLGPGAREPAVQAALQERLPRWGGREAVTRTHQSSHQMLDNEIQEQRLLGTVLPLVFTAVSVFLLHVVMTRLVATQREQIASLKALGFSNAALAVHQLQLVMVIALIGVGIGGWLGLAAGRWLLGLYTEFFRFPSLPLVVPAGAWALAVSVALVSAGLGVAQALVGILRLSPAEAMQPLTPPASRPGWWERLSAASGRMPLVLRMILRQLARRPWRSVFSVAGVASALALVVMGHFFRDAIESIVSRQFEVVWRGDVQVITVEAVSLSALGELARRPGVQAVEGSRSVAATLVNGHRRRRVALRGLNPQGHQQRLVDLEGRVVVPGDGTLVLTDRLAHQLGVREGDALEVLLTEGSHPRWVLRVGQVMPETMGLNATTTLSTLNRLMQESDRVNGLSIRVEPQALQGLLDHLAELPRVAGSFSKAHLLRNMQDISARNIRIMSGVMTGFALVVAVGVVYNNARIALAERAWELASLRVLGFSRREVAQLLVGEQALLVMAAIPLGLLGGWALVSLLSWGLRSDQFQFPIVIWPRTHVMAAGSVIAAAVLSSLVVWRRVLQLDMVSALKARE